MIERLVKEIEIKYCNTLFDGVVDNEELVLNFVRLTPLEKDIVIQYWNELIFMLNNQERERIIDCLINSFFLSDIDIKKKIIKLLNDVSHYLDIDFLLKCVDILIAEVDKNCRKDIINIIDNCFKHNFSSKVYEFYQKNSALICVSDCVADIQYTYETQVLFIIPYFYQKISERFHTTSYRCNDSCCIVTGKRIYGFNFGSKS